MPKKQISVLEKWTLGLSIAAVLISIGMPVVSYYWFDPQLQTFMNRAKLQIVEVKKEAVVTTNGPSSFEDIKNEEMWWKSLSAFFEFNPWSAEIHNTGNLSGKDVLVAAKYSSPLIEKKEEKASLGVAMPDIKFEPPAPFEKVVNGDTIMITLKRAIAPQDKIKVTFSSMPNTVWVSNEYGESSSIETAAGSFRFFKDIDVEKFWKTRVQKSPKDSK